MNKTSVPLIAAMAFASVLPAVAAEDWHQVNSFELEGPGAWDYLSWLSANTTNCPARLFFGGIQRIATASPLTEPGPWDPSVFFGRVN